MNEAQFEEYLTGAAEAVQGKNDLLEQTHGIGHFAHWITTATTISSRF